MAPRAYVGKSAEPQHFPLGALKVAPYPIIISALPERGRSPDPAPPDNRHRLAGCAGWHGNLTIPQLERVAADNARPATPLCGQYHAAPYILVETDHDMRNPAGLIAIEQLSRQFIAPRWTRHPPSGVRRHAGSERRRCEPDGRDPDDCARRDQSGDACTTVGIGLLIDILCGPYRHFPAVARLTGRNSGGRLHNPSRIDGETGGRR